MRQAFITHSKYQEIAGTSIKRIYWEYLSIYVIIDERISKITIIYSKQRFKKGIILKLHSSLLQNLKKTQSASYSWSCRIIYILVHLEISLLRY